MQYKITDKQDITLDENGNYNFRDLCTVAMNVAGLKLEESGDNFDLYFDPADTGTRLLVVFGVTDEQSQAMAKEKEAVAYNPLLDMSMAQVITRNLGISLVPVVTVNGNLSGLWRAEHLGNYGTEPHTFISTQKPTEEFISSVHKDPIIAIYLCAAGCIGVGRNAYISFDATGNASVIYRTPENVAQLYSVLNQSVFHAPELEYFNVTGAPTDVLNKAISDARVKYDQAKAQAAAEALEQSESDVPAEENAVPAQNAGQAENAAAAGGVAGAATDAEAAAADTDSGTAGSATANDGQGQAADSSVSEVGQTEKSADSANPSAEAGDQSGNATGTDSQPVSSGTESAAADVQATSGETSSASTAE